MLHISLPACAGIALLSCACAVQAATLPSIQDAAQSDPLPLADYSLEQLSEIVVTSVSRQRQSVARAPASVYVIQGADIARAGATTLPEALRLAPNLQVARISAASYAISARGFLSPLANKLLVMIDGRSVYSPLFSGVFWEMQDVALEDVERIEVISGPGGTAWGTNAVNGVINIITRSAADTHGGVATVYGGAEEAGVAVRNGGQLDNGAHWRAYARSAEFDGTRNAPGQRAQGGLHRRQAGFRLDRQDAGQDLTLSGDVHQSTARQGVLVPRTAMAGANLLGRIERRLDGDGVLRLQAWVDHGRRDQTGVGKQRLDTLDLEVQHLLHLPGHALSWGAGHRHVRDRIESGPLLRFVPERRSLRWSHLFVQDEVRLAPGVRASAGLRIEHNVFTGGELLPNARLAWDVNSQAMLWAGLSRTVRAPARLDRDLFLMNPVDLRQTLIAGGAETVSETARVAELGYRAQPSPALSYSATLFYTDFERLRSLEPVPGSVPDTLPTWVFGNLGKGALRGIEFWAAWQAARGWRLHAGGVWQDVDVGRESASRDITGLSGLAGNDPRLTWTVRSAHDLSARLRADISLRYAARLPQAAVPSYHELDARLAWQVRPGLELALAGRNLLHARHAEFGEAGSRQLIERTVSASAVLRF